MTHKKAPRRIYITFLFAVVILTAAGMIGLGILNSSQPFLNADQSFNAPVGNTLTSAGTTGSLTFAADAQSYKVNDTFDVRVNMDTGSSPIVGYTLRTIYDPSILQPVNNPPLVKGNLPLNPLGSSTLISPNIIKFEEMTMTPYSGSGLSGTITFRAIASGQTAVSCFKTDPSNPNYVWNTPGISDCDLVSPGGDDILSTVNPLNLTVTGSQVPAQAITTAPKASSITKTSAVITWGTKAASSSLVQYGATTSYGQSATSSAQTNDHTLTLSNLSPNTTYHYKVTSDNSNANPASVSSGDNSFKTLPPDAIPAPSGGAKTTSPGQTTSTTTRTTQTTTAKPANIKISPTASTVTLSKTSVVADGLDFVTVNITAKDTANKTIINIKPSISVSGKQNKLSEPKLVGEVWQTTISSTHSENKTITVTVNGTALAAAPTVNFTPAAGILGWIKHAFSTNQRWIVPFSYTTGAAIILLCLFLIYRITKSSEYDTELQEA